METIIESPLVSMALSYSDYNFLAWEFGPIIKYQIWAQRESHKRIEKKFLLSCLLALSPSPHSVFYSRLIHLLLHHPTLEIFWVTRTHSLAKKFFIEIATFGIQHTVELIQAGHKVTHPRCISVQSHICYRIMFSAFQQSAVNHRTKGRKTRDMN